MLEESGLDLFHVVEVLVLPRVLKLIDSPASGNRRKRTQVLVKRMHCHQVDQNRAAHDDVVHLQMGF